MTISSSLVSSPSTAHIKKFTQVSQATNKPFQVDMMLMGKQFLPSVVRQQISLTGDRAKSPQPLVLASTGGSTSANHQPASNSSFLKLAALMSQEELNTMSDANIKQLFTETKDPELKSQLGTEAEIRRKKSTNIEPVHTNTRRDSSAQADNKVKWAVVSLDDMNRPSTSEVLKKFKALDIPVTLYPMNEERYLDTITGNLKKAQELGVNSRTGVHGFKTGMLDSQPLPGATTAAAAWPDATPKKDEKQNVPYLTNNTVIRGSGCVVNKWGSFDQHNLKSCTINDIPSNQRSLNNAVKDLKEHGGALSIHLHDKHGLDHFEKVIKELKNGGVQFKFIEQLRGKGAPVTE